jgi:glycolate oxidase
MLPNPFLNDLHQAIGPAQVWTEPAVCLVYERDANFLATSTPSVIVSPQTVSQLQAVVQACHQHAMAYTVRGAGTGQSGGAVPTNGGVVISLAQWRTMDLARLAQRTVFAQPGVANGDLKQALAPRGALFAPDPSSQTVCTLGGNWAENAGGIHCIKDGVTADHTLALQLVLPSGQVTTTGTPTVVHPEGTGLALLSLMVGSEGTLGILTGGWVRTIPKPTHTAVTLTAFSTLKQAAAAVAQVLASGITVSALELIDQLTVQCVNRAFGVGFPDQCAAVLLCELVAFSPAELAVQTQVITAVLQAQQPLEHRATDQPQQVEAFWQARRGAAASYGLLTPAFYVLDCVIPPSQLAPALARIAEIAAGHDLVVGNVFHAGDGNLHPHLFFDPHDLPQTERVKQAAKAITALCVSLGGTLSGEHGIGLEKRDSMGLQFTPADLHWMYEVKAIFDPEGLCNPGKILPAKGFCGEANCSHGDSALLPATRPAALSAAGLWI